MVIKTFLDQCKDDINCLKDITKKLIDLSSIGISNNDYVMAPRFYWERLLPEGETVQTKSILLLNDIISRLDLLFNEKPNTIVERYEKFKNFFKRLIKREEGGWDWSVPATTHEVEKELNKETEEIIILLDWLNSLGEKEIILVPDTNALIINRKFESYGALIQNVEKYTVIITSSVLRELDELKYKNNNNEFREKVKAAINYIKGLRGQGDAINGIKIFNNKITFKLLPIEPNMDNTLPWLDASNIDDRIIASCYELQVQNPASSLILITEDINLQTKATLARLPFVEPEID